jgi:hypothetical protein
VNDTGSIQWCQVGDPSGTGSCSAVNTSLAQKCVEGSPLEVKYILKYIGAVSAPPLQSYDINTEVDVEVRVVSSITSERPRTVEV